MLENGACINPLIANCKVINGENGTLCDECWYSFSLSDDHTSCIDCISVEGCRKCKGSQDDFRCYECMFPLLLSAEGECEWEECLHFDADSDGTACFECIEGFGLREEDGLCYRCPKHGAWKDCSSCSIDADFVPFNCESCLMGKQLIDNPHGVLPLKICGFPMIQNCEEMDPNENICLKCE